MKEPSGEKRIRKSFEHRIIDGVCGGVAEYFGIDPTLVRIGLVLAAFAGGIGIFLYIVAMIIMPSPIAEQMLTPAGKRPSSFLLVLGIVLASLGTILFIGVTDLVPFHWFHGDIWELILPIALIGLGIGLLVRRGSGSDRPPEAAAGMAQGIQTRRLYRSRKEKKLFGVCGGLGNYFGIDPVIVRLIFVVCIFVSFGLTIVAYIVLSLFAPQEPVLVSA
ncbi:MAG: PspC domain-containing protein [Ignavibacteria bacterium]|nr:PspC domain-containing protein [Ignavibacteria bacterium]